MDQNLAKEVILLRENKQINVESNILKLNRFFNGTGIMRLGGRLQISPLSYQAKHPIIFLKKAVLTDLIFNSHIVT